MRCCINAGQLWFGGMHLTNASALIGDGCMRTGGKENEYVRIL